LVPPELDKNATAAKPCLGQVGLKVQRLFIGTNGLIIALLPMEYVASAEPCTGQIRVER